VTGGAGPAAVYRALEGVYDTCSLFNRTDLNIVEMGLVQGVEHDGRRVRVTLQLTDPLCLYFFEIGQRIREVLAALPGIEEVEVATTPDALWTPDRLAPAAAARLARLRAVRLARLGRPPPGDHRASEQPPAPNPTGPTEAWPNDRRSKEEPGEASHLRPAVPRAGRARGRGTGRDQD
jgi:metal-sulfur cluster biosynthetic enzyme